MTKLYGWVGQIIVTLFFMSYAGEIQKTYYEDGKLKGEYGWENSKINGPYKIYYKTGQIMKSGQYVNGIQTGVWITYSVKGDTLKETEYNQKGQIIGNIDYRDPSKKELSEKSDVDSSVDVRVVNKEVSQPTENIETVKSSQASPTTENTSTVQSNQFPRISTLQNSQTPLLYVKQKDPFLAAFSGLVVPGGANIYSEHYILGAVLAVFECVGIVTFVVGQHSNDNTQVWGAIIWPVCQITDVYTGMVFANKYTERHSMTNTFSIKNSIHSKKFAIPLLSLSF